MMAEDQLSWTSDLGVVDELGSQIPVIGGGISSSLPLILTFGLCIKVLLPFWMIHRKPFSVQPLMLIWSGLLFGINGAGFLVALSLTGLGTDTLKCQRPSDRFTDMVIIHSGTAYFMVKFLDFGRTVFATLRKKSEQTDLLNFLQLALLILLIQSGIYYNPGGVGYFIGIVDTFLGVFINSYYILSTAKSVRNLQSWKRRVVHLQVLGYTVLCVHALLFLNDTSCKGHKMVMLFQIAYGASSLLLTLHKYKQFFPFNLTRVGICS